MSAEEEKVVVFEKTDVDAPAPAGDTILVNETRTAKYYAKKVTVKEAEKLGVKRRTPKKKVAPAPKERPDPVMNMLSAKMEGMTLVSPDDVIASSQEEGSANTEDELTARLAGMNTAEGWGGEGGRRKKTRGVFKRKTRKTRGRKRRITRRR